MSTYSTFEARGFVHRINARVTKNGHGVADVFLQWQTSEGFNQYTPVTLWSNSAHLISAGDEIILKGSVKNTKHKRRDQSEYWMLEAIAESYEGVHSGGAQYSSNDSAAIEPNF